MRSCYNLPIFPAASPLLACERRRISGCRLGSLDTLPKSRCARWQQFHLSLPVSRIPQKNRGTVNSINRHRFVSHSILPKNKIYQITNSPCNTCCFYLSPLTLYILESRTATDVHCPFWTFESSKCLKKIITKRHLINNFHIPIYHHTCTPMNKDHALDPTWSHSPPCYKVEELPLYVTKQRTCTNPKQVRVCPLITKFFLHQGKPC